MAKYNKKYKRKLSRKPYKKSRKSLQTKYQKVTKKYYDFETNPTLVNIGNAAPMLYCLNDMAQGTTENTRIGDNIKMHSMDVRVRCTTENTEAERNGSLRVYIVQDRQTNGAAPGGDVFSNATAPISLVNLKLSKRYKVLGDRVWDIPFQDNQSNNQTALFTWKQKLSFTTMFSGAGAGFVNVQTNSLFLIIEKDNCAGAVQNQKVQVSSRVTYSDC